jgi:hypothetical protein
MSATTLPERTALILVRAWAEPDSEHVHARLIGVVDLLSGHETSAAAYGVDEVCELVRAWLTPLTAAADQAP